MKCRVLFAAALAIALASCAKKHPSAPIVVTPEGPSAATPAGAVQRLAWAIQTRNAAAYVELLTDDYAFVFAPSDTMGNGFPGRSLDCSLEGEVMRHMLVGGGSIPPATDVQFAVQSVLVPPMPWFAMKRPRSTAVAVTMRFCKALPL